MTLNRHKNNYIITTSLESEPMGKLINRIPGWHLLISSLPGSASRMHVELFDKPRDSTSVLTLPDKLDTKDTHLVFYILHTTREGLSSE